MVEIIYPRLASESTLSGIKAQLDVKLSELLDDVKGAWRLGVKNLDLSSTDPQISVPSGVEADFADMNLANKYFNYGITRCHGNCVLKAGGKLKLCAGSIFKFVR